MSVKKRIDGITVATIYKHRNYDDLYVVISMVEGVQNKIGDNAGSEFYSKKHTDSEKYSEDYYTRQLLGLVFLCVVKNIKQFKSL